MARDQRVEEVDVPGHFVKNGLLNDIGTDVTLHTHVEVRASDRIEVPVELVRALGDRPVTGGEVFEALDRKPRFFVPGELCFTLGERTGDRGLDFGRFLLKTLGARGVIVGGDFGAVSILMRSPSSCCIVASRS